jgi:LPS-assembly lipoprotein
MKRILFLITTLVFLLHGCGFYLRGSRPLEIQNTRIFLKSQGARAIADQIKQQLEIHEIPVVTNPKEAEVVVTLSNEQQDRRVLSVDPRTGKWREFELNYRVAYAIDRPDGTPLVKKDTIRISRDHAFDETAVISKSDEEELVREEMMKDAADTVLRRLERVKIR